MKKEYQKILSAGLLVMLLFSISAHAVADSVVNSASAEVWTEVRTSSRGNLVVGDGSAVSIRSEDIQKLTGNLNTLGSDFKASKKDLGSRLSTVEGEIANMKTSFQAGVNELCAELEGLECAPAERTPAGIRAQIAALSQKRYDAGYAAGLSEGGANADPDAVLREYVLVKSYVVNMWDTNYHTTTLVQKVAVYRLNDEGSLDISPSETSGEIYRRPGYYTIQAKCTSVPSTRCYKRDGCLSPGYQAAVVTMQRDARVRIYKTTGVTEQEFKTGDIFQVLNEEAFMLL